MDEIRHPAATTDKYEKSIIRWQEGPIGSGVAGPNGCTLEDVLGLCLTRLRKFNSTPARCRENSIAITKIEEALHWLDARTKRRQRQGIEGTYAEREG